MHPNKKSNGVRSGNRSGHLWWRRKCIKSNNIMMKILIKVILLCKFGQARILVARLWIATEFEVTRFNIFTRKFAVKQILCYRHSLDNNNL